MKKLKEKSKILITALRHTPELLLLNIDNEGYVSTEQVLHNLQINIDELNWIVDNNDKKRFKFNNDKSKIRASQGHSIDVKISFNKVKIDTILYHGTSENNIESIFKKGLLKGERTHVHLSGDVETAYKVGSRKGSKIVIIIVDIPSMLKDGYELYQSENGVYLMDYVPSKYLKLIQ